MVRPGKHNPTALVSSMVWNFYETILVYYSLVKENINWKVKGFTISKAYLIIDGNINIVSELRQKVFI